MTNDKFVHIYAETVPEVNRIKTYAPIKYKEVTVPVGYVSDGLTKLVNKYSPNCLRAALVHDFICETRCLPRKTGDQYFLEILKLDGVKWFKRNRMYYAVRAYAIATGKK